MEAGFLVKKRFTPAISGPRMRAGKIVTNWKVIIVNRNDDCTALFERPQISDIPASLIIIGNAVVKLRHVTRAPLILVFDTQANRFQSLPGRRLTKGIRFTRGLSVGHKPYLAMF